jgi:hypothetical protein
MHRTTRDQASDSLLVHAQPAAPASSRRKELSVLLIIDRFDLTIDPTEAERSFDSVSIRNTAFPWRLAIEQEPDAR